MGVEESISIDFIFKQDVFFSISKIIFYKITVLELGWCTFHYFITPNIKLYVSVRVYVCMYVRMCIYIWTELRSLYSALVTLKRKPESLFVGCPQHWLSLWKEKSTGIMLLDWNDKILITGSYGSPFVFYIRIINSLIVRCNWKWLRKFLYTQDIIWSFWQSYQLGLPLSHFTERKLRLREIKSLQVGSAW